MGKLKQGSNPHIGAIAGVRGETSEAESEAADLRQPKWNENHTIFAPTIHALDKDAGPLKGTEAGSWILQSNPRGRSAIAVGRQPRRHEGEIVMGNAHAGNPGSHGSKAMLLSHA